MMSVETHPIVFVILVSTNGVIIGVFRGLKYEPEPVNSQS
jgi:hypothetical protein